MSCDYVLCHSQASGHVQRIRYLPLERVQRSDPDGNDNVTAFGIGIQVSSEL